MTDSGTDAFVGVVIAAVIVVAVVSGARGEPIGTTTKTPTSSSSTTPSTTTTTTASTNIPGGTLRSCAGTSIADDSAPSGTGSLDLNVTYTTTRGGRNCATATASHLGRGRLTVELRFASYSGRRWPSFAEHRGAVNATRSGAVYLDKTDGRCVRATARFVPANGGKTVTVTSGKVGCR